jgi:MOSC domain-containing protein YiiM
MIDREGFVISVNISKKKSVRKAPVSKGLLIENMGFDGDAHAGDWHRQVSLLAEESIKKMKDKGLDVKAGDFAENITTRGIELLSLPPGARIYIEDRVEMEVTQIGKVCHTKCAIYYQAGDCVMPTEGIFARVIRGGEVRQGDRIRASFQG